MQSEWGLIAKARPVNNQRLKAVSLGEGRPRLTKRKADSREKKKM